MTVRDDVARAGREPECEGHRAAAGTSYGWFATAHTAGLASWSTVPNSQHTNENETGGIQESRGDKAQPAAVATATPSRAFLPSVSASGTLWWTSTAGTAATRARRPVPVVSHAARRTRMRESGMNRSRTGAGETTHSVQAPDSRTGSRYTGTVERAAPNDGASTSTSGTSATASEVTAAVTTRRGARRLRTNAVATASPT